MTEAVEYDFFIRKRASDVIDLACDQLGGNLGQSLNVNLTLITYYLGTPSNRISNLISGGGVACAAKKACDISSDIKGYADREVGK